MLISDRVEIAAAYVGAASTCNAGMARADPMMVCGLVNLHKTLRNDCVLEASLSLADDVV